MASFLPVCIVLTTVPVIACWDITSLLHGASSSLVFLWKTKSGSQVEVDWGLPDTRAPIGRVLQYQIPATAFKGDNLSYKVQEAGTHRLPSWLYFDHTSSTLIGIPSFEDDGTVLIEVTASSLSTSHSVSTTFLIQVQRTVSKSAQSLDIGSKFGEKAFELESGSSCMQGEVEVTLTLLLDRPFNVISVQDKVRVITRVASYLSKPVYALRLLPEYDRLAKKIRNQHVLIAGPGSVTSDNIASGSELSWVISCGDFEQSEDISTVMEHNIASGRLGELLRPVHLKSWFVSQNHEPGIKRVRRQIKGTATPSISSMAPTQISTIPTSTILPTESTVVTTPSLPTTLTSSPLSASSGEISSSLPMESPGPSSMYIHPTSSITVEPTLSVSGTITPSLPLDPSSSSVVISSLSPSVTTLTGTFPSQTPSLETSIVSSIESTISPTSTVPFLSSGIGSTNTVISTVPIDVPDTSVIFPSSSFYDVPSSTLVFTTPGKVTTISPSGNDTQVPDFTTNVPENATSDVDTSTVPTTDMLTTESLPDTNETVTVPSLTTETITKTPEITTITEGPSTLTTTEAPTSDTPLTEAPTTKAVTTEHPITEAPSTEAPTTEARSTEAPTTEAPTTEAPTTEAPTTEAPATDAPPTEAPTTEAPTTEAPTTEAPTTEAPTTEAPTTEVPMTEAPTTEAPTTEVPTTEAPTTEAPTTEAPTTEAPTTEAPTTKATTTESPTTEAPTTETPTTEAPTTEAPSTEAPTTKAPTTEAPTTEAPTTKAPTTEAPTTEAPTTEAPTTEAPTTEAPTTEPATTEAPTTEAVTTYPSSTSVLTTSVATTPPPTTVPPVNTPPILQNPIDRISTQLGTYFRYIVPEDTFYDAQDGNTRNLQLAVFTIDGQNLTEDSFVQFDDESQVIFGIPLNRNLTDTLFYLSATDSGGLTVRDAFEVRVDTSNLEDISFTFQSRFSISYTEFISKTSNVIDMLTVLNSYYGDSIQEGYTSVTDLQNGSVDLFWTNGSVTKDWCDNTTILDLYSQIELEVDGVKMINPAFKLAMMPNYPVSYVDMQWRSVCLLDGVTTEPPYDGSSEDDSLPLWLLIFLPILIIILIILIIILVCCIVRRKRKNEAGRWMPEDEKPIFGYNRKPVLLENELELQDAATNKPRKPVIMTDDSQPYNYANTGFEPGPSKRKPPPEYQSRPPSRLDPEDLPDSESPPPDYYVDPYHRVPPPAYRLPPPYIEQPGASEI